MAVFTIASLFALAASSLATSNEATIQKRNSLGIVNFPTPSDVQAAINDWNSDVIAVNVFLDGVPSKLADLPGLATSAQDTLSNFASDEGSQLNTLNNWFVNTSQPDNGLAPVAFNCAFNDLANGQKLGNVLFNFETLVIGVFNNIVSDAQAGRGDAVQAQVDVVNSYRCCNVLPDLDILWRDAAQSAGFAEVDCPRTPPRPIACGSSDCSKTEGASTCGTLDNGRFGAPGS